MKETKIGKENIEKLKKKALLSLDGIELEGICQAHKQTCQRWLGFLKKFPKHILLSMLDGNKTEMILNKLKDEKITDLKQAIKIYKEEGI